MSGVLLAGLGLLVASCGAPERAEEKLADDYLCDLPVKSEERRMVQEELGSDDFHTTIFATPGNFASRMEGLLRNRESGKDSPPTDVCLFRWDTGGTDTSVRMSFQWGEPVEKKAAGRSPLEARTYGVNGLPAEAGAIEAKLSFPCVMGGKNRVQSQRVQLIAWAAFLDKARTGSRSDRGTGRSALTYLMAQRAADALGCENEPLRGEPAVKPGG
ncbi:hypothetical protein AB0N23_11070 [Streptomyces sp. NPDC052644]